MQWQLTSWFQLGTSRLRRLTQVGFTLFIGFLVINHLLVGESATTVTTSAEAFCPFGGVETLYQYVTNGGTINHTHLSNLVLLIAVIALTIVACGAFFVTCQRQRSSRAWKASHPPFP